MVECLIMPFPVNMLVSVISVKRLLGFLFRFQQPKAEIACRKNTHPRTKMSFAVKEAWRGSVKEPELS